MKFLQPVTPITSKNHLNPFHFETSAEPITAGKSSYCFHADISAKSGKVYPSIDVVSCNKKKRKRETTRSHLPLHWLSKRKFIYRRPACDGLNWRGEDRLAVDYRKRRGSGSL